MNSSQTIRRSLAQGLVSIFLVLFSLTAVSSAFAQELNQKIDKRSTSFYRDFCDSVVYELIAGLLHFDKLWNRMTAQKHAAFDLNPFDEVLDSTFFVNRHGKKRLSVEELIKGSAKGSGPDTNGPWRVLEGKTEGVSTGLFIADNKGEQYLLKFDPKDNPDMATAAEIISHKFFHAIGYYVPEYYLVRFNPDILQVDPAATYYDGDGFKRSLTEDALWDLLRNAPKYRGGLLRASASKLLLGSKGYMDFEGRRKSDPDDLISHERRRTIRALRVFGSWLNHYDLRKGNTLDVVETVDGTPKLVHYLIDFGSTLGSAADHPKVPVAGHEHIVDWFAIGEAIPTLKVIEKPWEKRWDKLNRGVEEPAAGYFDNFYFDPSKWKTQLHYEAFRQLTAGDAFWAAKILKSFSDEEIKAVVGTPEFSEPKIAGILSQILIDRRDIAARHWFSKVVPLDEIRLFKNPDGSYEIKFKDLETEYGFADAGGTLYRYRFQRTRGGEGRAEELGAKEFTSPSFAFEAEELAEGDRVTFLVDLKRAGEKSWRSPRLKISLTPRQEGSLQVAEIDHGV